MDLPLAQETISIEKSTRVDSYGWEFVVMESTDDKVFYSLVKNPWSKVQ